MSEIVEQLAEMTGLQPIAASAIVQLVGQMIANEITKGLEDMDEITVREAAYIAANAHVDSTV